MRLAYFFISLLFTTAFIVVLDRPWGAVPPIGGFLSPQHGFWQNAEPANIDFSGHKVIPGLTKDVEVYIDDRLVPHIFAEDENDAVFIQGYLHAKFRLWQMEFQTHAAAGRLAEILGAGPDSAYLNNDRSMRRLGMVYGAKQSLGMMENDPVTKKQIDAYTAGVNHYIEQLTVAELPLEYRLLNYRPEKWTNLKTALFLMYMSFDLTGHSTDIEFTNARSFFSPADFNKLYPVIQDSLDPIIPKGTAFPAATVHPAIPPGADSLYFGGSDSTGLLTSKPDRSNGSNNWVLGGQRTASGRPMLCNDPHLGLNLPSLWYEMQISTPDYNAYGVSFPGAPSIIIGFNDSIAWGVTNAARDVRDHYSIRFREGGRTEYWYNNEWVKADLHEEVYRMKDGSLFIDTVAYTVFGPVMYDQDYHPGGQPNIPLAVRWRAHEPSNELKTFYLLNRARNYNDFEDAIAGFVCPGQNFAYADKEGNIAVWQQGRFPAKWFRQGDWIMPGTDSLYRWQADIPREENPHVLNPTRGFVSSANQMPADTSYPYYLGGRYDVYRGLIINRDLEEMHSATPADMQRMQTDNYNVFAETALPFLLAHIQEDQLSATEKKYLTIVRSWNRRNDPAENGATVFSVWFTALGQLIWNDELQQQPQPFETPDDYTLIDALKKDSLFPFIDNVTTPAKETLEDQVTRAFAIASSSLDHIEKQGRLNWDSYKDAGIRHLLRLAPLSRYHLSTGGGANIINATKQFHGPSWRMIVHMTDNTEAYGIYPGGQSGNPGSRYYDGFVDDWAAGKYHRLWVMKKGEQNDERVKHVIRFSGM